MISKTASTSMASTRPARPPAAFYEEGSSWILIHYAVEKEDRKDADIEV